MRLIYDVLYIHEQKKGNNFTMKRVNYHLTALGEDFCFDWLFIKEKANFRAVVQYSALLIIHKNI